MQRKQEMSKMKSINNKNKLSNPIGTVLTLIGAKWKILIISELMKKEKRFSELKKTLGCTSKVLINCLKEMEKDGLVVREEEEISHRVQVYYYLTDIGYTMRPIVESMQQWGKDYRRLIKLQEHLYKIN